ncbi:MAG: hypothetical protein ACK2UL_07420 [Anaerolineae bacterium]
MLPDIPFDIIEGGDTHHYVTDEDGVIRICFDEPTLVLIRERTQQIGGTWYTTTEPSSSQYLQCGEVELWIGNAQVKIPETGGRR